MKKILLFTMSICIVITSLFTGLSAFADDATAVTKATVTEKAEKSASYLITDYTTYTYSNVGDFITVINSGKDVSAYKEGFANSVKENLDANDGKIIIADTVYDENWQASTVSRESAATYGGVIVALDLLGYDVKDFNGYDITSSFAKMDFTTNTDNPYLYYLSIEGAVKAGFEASTIKVIANDFVNQYYKLGSGLDYYGYSCDNTAMAVVTLAPYYDTYKTIIDDALDLIETYKVDGGYYSTSAYGSTEANTDSTALALAAYSAVGNYEKAETIYNDLCKFETSEAGVFGYTDNEDANSYATKDALFGLVKFASIIVDEEPVTEPISDTTTTTTTTTQPATTTTTVATTNTTTATTTTQPSTEVATTETATKLKKTSISKVAKGKKSLKVTWKKISSVTGYQVQYSTSVNFYNNKTTTVTVKGNSTTAKTVKNLKSNKTYYVRVRTYKKTKVNGKTVTTFSDWSNIKTAKIK